MRWPKKSALAGRREMMRVGIGEQPLVRATSGNSSARINAIFPAVLLMPRGRELKMTLLHNLIFSSNKTDIRSI